jgi:UDP-N-acetylglucosamine 2-epimerase (non-hydrolysing)
MTAPVAVILGTRPEIVKLAPLIKELGPQALVIHTGQHFDYAMSGIFFAECGLEPPEHVFAVGGKNRIGQIAGAALVLDDLFARQRPQLVVVQGDTNSTLAGAMTANAHDVPLLHLEAGLRSYDRAMPEEHNRVLVDHLSDILCAATESNAANLAGEGIAASRVVVTGNTVVEAVQAYLPSEQDSLATLREYGLADGGYVLATMHRPENTDDPGQLSTICAELAALAGEGWPVIMPLHPRTLAAAAELPGALAKLMVCAPVGYRDFLSLARHAALVISDSGGVQEEVTVLKRPLLVVRRSTERPEAMRDFASLVTSSRQLSRIARQWLSKGDAVHQRLRDLPSPFGDGHAASRVAALIRDRIS